MWPPSILEELNAVLPYFADPESFDKRFGIPNTSEEQEDGDEAEADQTGMLDKCKESYSNMVTHKALDFGHDLMSGTYDDVLKGAIKDKASLQDVTWDSVGIESLRELTRALNMQKSVIQISKGDVAPPPSTRTLQRFGSDANPDEVSRQTQMLKERQDVWKQVVAKRKTLVTVGHAKIGVKAHAQTFYEKCTSVYNYEAKPGQAHRVFLFSAELFHGCRDAPWSNSTPFDRAATPVLEFMLGQTSPGDLLILMVGRSRSWRKEVDKNRAPGSQWTSSCRGPAMSPPLVPLRQASPVPIRRASWVVWAECGANR